MISTSTDYFNRYKKTINKLQFVHFEATSFPRLHIEAYLRLTKLSKSYIPSLIAQLLTN